MFIPADVTPANWKSAPVARSTFSIAVIMSATWASLARSMLSA